MLNENLSELEKCSSPLIFLYQQVLHRQDYLDASDVTYGKCALEVGHSMGNAHNS